MKTITCDGEWTYEELHGIAYDECMRACKSIPFLLDKKNLDKPDILLETIIDELDMDFVDIYDNLYENRDKSESSDDVFNKWDNWMQDRIQHTILSHKHPLYIN